MRNKIRLKRCLVWSAIVVGVFLFLAAGMQHWTYQMYTANYNRALLQMMATVKDSDSNVSEQELMEILNTEVFVSGEQEADFAKKYGIDLTTDSLLLANDTTYRRVVAGSLGLVLAFAAILMGVFLHYNREKDRELEKITGYIEQINQKNYRLELEELSEDELSILKTEIAKTTVMLKEAAEYAIEEKKKLRDSLSDISHQLKTPLTSMSVLLDNLVDDPEMSSDTRQQFLRQIRREITNINFLVQSLLKLSKLDSGTIVFRKESVHAREIVEEAVRNVSALSDLRSVRIELKTADSDEICCDARWQVEAVTNILKNAVEHSYEGGLVKIEILSNASYVAISIRDYGQGIRPEEEKHLFERFYRGSNASKDSMGIGLALAKAIVEEDHGHISVELSEIGTRFIVKYFLI